MSNRTKPEPRTFLRVSALEDRVTPASAAADVTEAAGPYAVGVTAGETGDVVVHAADGSELFTVAAPYGADFTGGVRTAMADVTGDGVEDLILAPGPGTAPTVQVYDGASQAQVAAFDAYETTFNGGVYVAAADLTGDGAAEIVTGADLGGGPRVRVFDGATAAAGTDPTVLADFLAIDDANFRGGVRLSLGDINADGTADLVVGAGFGGGPRVAVYDGAALGGGEVVKLVDDFFAFEQTLRNGVFPSVGDLNGDGCGDMIFGAGPGGGPRVMALDGKEALEGRESRIADFFAGDTGSRDGVEVGTMTAADGTTSIVTAEGATGEQAAFGADGRGHGMPHGRGRGMIGHAPPPDATTPTDNTPTEVTEVTDETAAALVGSYTGSGDGTVMTAVQGSEPTSVDATATVTLDITDATVIEPPAMFADAPALGVRVTGTLTVTIDGVETTMDFTGVFRVSQSGSDDSGDDATGLSGKLRLVATPADETTTTPTQVFTLDAEVEDGAISVGRLALFTRTDDGHTVFRLPASRDADPVVLSRATTTATA